MSYEKQNFTSGQVLTAAALNHMEDGIANAGGAQSWNDLKDKPFYETTEMVEILPELSATGQEGDSDSYFYCWDGLPFIEIKEGIEYSVTINGDVYNAVGDVVPLPSDLTPEDVAEMGIIKTTGIHIYNGSNEFVISTLLIGNGGYNNVYWSKTWGETISLKLIAKTKKVKPLNKVFLGGEVETVEVYRNDSLSLSSEYTGDDGRLAATHEDWDIGKKLFKKDHTYKVVWNGKEYTFIASVKQQGYNSLSLGDFYYHKDSFEIAIMEDDMPNKPCLWITWDVTVHGKAISVVIYDMESEVESGDVCNVIIRDNTVSGGTLTCNKTVEQIKQAYLSGKAISAILSLDNDYNIKHLIMDTSDPINLGFVSFSTPLEYGYKNLKRLIYHIESDGSVTYQYWTQDISIPE